MTSQEKYEIQLGTLAGCIEYLSGQPKCKIAAHKLFTKLRTEQLKVMTSIQDNEWINSKHVTDWCEKMRVTCYCGNDCSGDPDAIGFNETICKSCRGENNG